MGLFTNVGGELKELSSLTTTVGGELKEINSLTANIGGQPKEIFNTQPIIITGTYHLTHGVSYYDFKSTSMEDHFIGKTPKLPKRNFKMTVVVTITDGYLYKKLSSTREQLHGVEFFIGDIYSSMHIDVGSDFWNETQTTYTEEVVRYGTKLSELDIYGNRFALSQPIDNNGNLDNMRFYNNDLLSFDYSITFTPV